MEKYSRFKKLILRKLIKDILKGLLEVWAVRWPWFDMIIQIV
jgi:hypothetical protein